MVICIRCKHEWKSDVESPKMCPKCKSYKWDIPLEINKDFICLDPIPADIRTQDCKFKSIDSENPCKNRRWYCTVDRFVYCENHLQQMMSFHSALRGNECHHPEVI